MSLLTLTFTRDNISNTQIVDDDSLLRYEVTTLFPPKSRPITQVCDGDGRILAALEWYDVRSDRVAFGPDVNIDERTGDATGIAEGKGFSMNGWMRKSMIPFNSSVSFEDPEGRKYKWKGCGAGESLELYALDTPGSPVAQFQKSYAREQKPAKLVVAPRGQEILDTIVCAFLFLEKSRRAMDNSTLMRGDGTGVLMGAIGGY